MKARTFMLTSLVSASLTVFLPVLPASAQAVSHDVVHDMRDQVVRSTNGSCVRTKWMSASDECGIAKAPQTPQARAPRAQNQQIPDEVRTVYFDFNASQLMASEKNKLNTLANTLKEIKEGAGLDKVFTFPFFERGKLLTC